MVDIAQMVAITMLGSDPVRSIQRVGWNKLSSEWLSASPKTPRTSSHNRSSHMLLLATLILLAAAADVQAKVKRQVSTVFTVQGAGYVSETYALSARCELAVADSALCVLGYDRFRRTWTQR